MLKRCLIALLAVLILGACAPHRPQTAQPRPLPARFSAAEEGPALTGRWWLAFDDPQLNGLMEQLFRSNLDLAQGHARLRQSEALQRKARSFRYPALTFDAQGGESSQPGVMGTSRGESAQLSVAAGFEIDLFGKLEAGSRAALLNYQASRSDLQSLYMSLSAQLADLYYLAIEQRAQLQLTDATIASYADSLTRVEERYRGGIGSVVDLYQARQNLAAAKAARLIYEQALSTAENALAVLLGDYPGSREFLQRREIPAAPPQLPAGLPAQLLTDRPDIRAALLRVEARDAETAAAIADRFPSFNLVASAGRSRSDVTGSLISGNFWSLLLKLSQPLFDGGRRKAEVERSRAQFAEAVAVYQQRVLKGFQEVEDALNGNRTTGMRIERLSEQVEATAAAQRLALERYLQGLSDYLPVLSAQIYNFNARSQLLAARRQLLSQRISLARALGGGWMAAQLDTDHQRLAAQGNEQ